jgi:hypothetical protein
MRIDQFLPSSIMEKRGVERGVLACVWSFEGKDKIQNKKNHNKSFDLSRPTHTSR